uniref:ADP-ribosylation factor-like protein 6-interacting protein 1 n=1 Tax=Phallusia mammillata TaxID=59560 RepID=A0A6F9D7E5_9ASCI|nr:ADP-ribosylation factor-like protein 6-interacting protein 1 [Phallusia mammillata]
MDSFESNVASGDFGSSSKSVKSNFKSWREIIVVASKLLKWEKPFYPGIVIGVITLKFLVIWYLDPSLITGLSMMMMMICILDYVMPFVSPLIFPETYWNGEKEKEYSNACKAIGEARSTVRNSLGSLFKLKDTNPWLYVAVSTVALSTLAWLGNQMHNLMLTYFIVLIIASLPGLAHHGLLAKGANAVGRFGKKRRD